MLSWCWNIPVAMEQIASIFSKNLKENLGFCMLRIRLVGRTARVLCRINNGQVRKKKEFIQRYILLILLISI
jgi:hypothetical protein